MEMTEGDQIDALIKQVSADLRQHAAPVRQRCAHSPISATPLPPLLFLHRLAAAHEAHRTGGVASWGTLERMASEGGICCSGV